MSSWFQSTGFSSTLSSLTESVQKATEQVQNVMPKEHKEFLAKLTLNTDEMINERQTFRQEALRREQAKTKLTKLLPWETNDTEREILVEECKDAILELSQHTETFFGPYNMPLLNVQLDDDDDDDEEEGVDGNAEEEEGEIVQVQNEGEKEDSNDDEDELVEATAALEVEEESEGDKKPAAKQQYYMKPSEESKEKLSKLQPLPPLLDDFDLDCHVGLIQKLLKEDPQLVKMQATYSGGGARERVFWQNYFFHCAFTRYEAGLSIDEIWSYQLPPENAVGEAMSSTASDKDKGDGDAAAANSNREEETVVFDDSNNASPEAAATTNTETHAGFQDVEEMMAADGGNTTTEGGIRTDLSEASPSNGFELVDDADDDDGSGDPELDELEAEIARELQD